MGASAARTRLASGLTALMLLVACADPGVLIAPNPPARPAPEPAPPEVTTPGPDSRALSTYYRRVQADLLTQGLLRGDGGGPDTRFSQEDLARNFVRIALFDEYVFGSNGVLRPEATISRLRRWESPIRLNVEFGATVPQAQRTQDAASISAFAARLQRLTGVPIRQGSNAPNFSVFVLNEDDRAGYATRLQQLVPGISASSVRAFLSPPRDTFCLAIAFSGPNASTYGQAIILIRGENPDLLRLACIHEEMSQAMGLANDSDTARPSLYNDNNEFGRLTTHDELLLRILYDDRLTPGMGAAQAAPIARQIAGELLGGES